MIDNLYESEIEDEEMTLLDYWVEQYGSVEGFYEQFELQHIRSELHQCELDCYPGEQQ